MEYKITPKKSSTFLFFKHFFQNNKFAFAILFLSCFGILESIMLPVINEFIVGILSPGYEYNLFVWVIVLLALLKISTVVSNFVLDCYINSKEYYILDKIKKDISVEYQKNDLLFQKNNVSSLFLKETKYADAVARFYSNDFLNFILNIFNMVVILPFMFFSIPVLAFVCLMAVVIILLMIELIKKLYKKRIEKSKLGNERIVSSLINIIFNNSNVEDKKNRESIIADQNKKLEYYSNAIKYADRQNLRLVGTSELFNAITSFVCLACFVSVLFLVFNMFKSYSIEIASYVQFYTFEIEFWTLFFNVVKYNIKHCEFDVVFKKLNKNRIITKNIKNRA